MIVDDLFGIVHAVFRLKIVVFREVLVCKGKESVSDVGADGFAEWGGGGGCTRVCRARSVSVCRSLVSI